MSQSFPHQPVSSEVLSWLRVLLNVITDVRLVARVLGTLGGFVVLFLFNLKHKCHQAELVVNMEEETLPL